MYRLALYVKGKKVIDVIKNEPRGRWLNVPLKGAHNVFPCGDRTYIVEILK
jgi:hypothetical protein